jgi:hypothetical protein
MRALLCRAILTISCLWVPCALAQEPFIGNPSQQPNATIRSGALVGMNSGQTFWIAPVDGKIQLFVAQDYIIPRKSGFWRVRLDMKWAAPKDSTGEVIEATVKDDPELSGVPPGYGLLWAVPLKKGMDAEAWPPTETKPAKPEEDNQEESTMEQMQREAEEEPHKLTLLFLGPDYVSYNEEYTVISSGGGTGGSSTDAILQITDAPAGPGSATDKLLVHQIPEPLDDATREKDLTACIDPSGQDEFSSEDFLRGAQESTFGLKRDKQRWVFDWDIGYAEGAARGYFTDCPVSLPPPASMVGRNELFPEWNKIRSAYPAATDAFSSPSHDLLLMVVAGKLLVAAVVDGKVGEPLARINLLDGPVMVQWATGKYADTWTKELTPYFRPYASDKPQRDPKLNNADGLYYMQQHKPASAVGYFVTASVDDSSNPEYTNNAGFAYYQMEKYEESVVWLQKTVSLDPKRAVAYLNLGDAYAKLNRNAEARQAYARYLELAPD